MISKTCEVRDEFVNVPNNLGDPKANTFDAKVTKLVIHTKHQILEVLQPFLFMHGFDKNRGYNMLMLMRDLRLKNMQLVANYCGHELTFALVKEYDVGLLLPMLV